MSIVSKIFGWSPYFEVAVRRIYWSSPWLIDLISKRDTRKELKPVVVDENSLGKILEFLQENGVGPGGLIVVHSSAEALKPTGKSPKEIIDELIKLLGQDGTLAMPAFPKYKDEPTGFDRMNRDVSDLILEYDVKKSIPWTGQLPYKLMRYPGSIRSRHPLNSMVAVGPLASPMMENNLLGKKPLPCGVQSSWNFCYQHNAKIIALGVDMAHSLTMIHVAEDSYEDDWPVAGWYRDRKFVVKDTDGCEEVLVRERHPKWAKYFAERTLSKDLKENKLMKSTVIGGILVEVLDAGELMNFLNERKDSAYPYFLVPLSNRRNVSS